MSEREYAIEDLLSVCIARQVQDGELLAQGLATPLVAAGYLLAWHTHAPNVYFASAIGQSVCRDGAPIGLETVEALWLDKSLMHVGFVSAATEILPRFKPKEFFRPGQIDKYGNFNNVFIGKNFRRPRLRLPGSGGIADVTPIIDKVYYSVPRHSRVTFVKQLDFKSGVGRHGNVGVAYYLVSDLGQFDFESSVMRLTHLHPGIALQRVKAKTGFEFEIDSDLKETAPPNAEELDLLYNTIDPLGIRKLEFLSGAKRRKELKIMLKQERSVSFHAV